MATDTGSTPCREPGSSKEGQFCVARLACIPCFLRWPVASRILTGTHQEPRSHLSAVKRILSSARILRRFPGDFLGTLRLISIISLEGNGRLKHQNGEVPRLARIERDRPRPCASDAQTALRRRHNSLSPQVGQNTQRPEDPGQCPRRGETRSHSSTKLQKPLGSAERRTATLLGALISRLEILGPRYIVTCPRLCTCSINTQIF